jgi:hypothetical protein
MRAIGVSTIGPGKNKRLPQFSAYLAVAHEAASRAKRSVWGVGGCVGAAAGLPAIFLLTNLMFGWLVAGAVTLFLGPALIAVALAIADRFVSRPRNEQERRQLAYLGVLNRYQGSVGKLHKELDPTAAQLLEASAFYWRRIHSTLNGPAWTDGASGRFAAIREQALRAADAAMEEATALCVNCLGKPERSRQEALKDALKDLKDLDIDDALDGFRRAATADSSKFAHHSPHINLVFEPVRGIAERLKALSAEVERMSTDALRRSYESAPLAQSTSTIDLVLREMSETRAAERELDEPAIERRVGDPGPPPPFP